MLKGFPPIIADQPIALILGSMPSVTSLEKQEYYGFSHNRFWKIMAAFYQVTFHDYEDKLNCITSHHLALWDVIHMCEREGSLDCAIRNVVPNPIEELILQYPSIKFIICNGKKSYVLYQKYFSHLPLPVYSLPSTSNANRTIQETELFQQWFSVLETIR